MEYFIIRIFKVRASDDVHDVNVDTSFKEFKKCGIMYIPLDIVPTLNPNHKIKRILILMSCLHYPLLSQSLT
jgi:hypothetical protein